MSGEAPPVSRVLSADAVRRLAGRVREVYLDERLRDYMVALVSATRSPREVGLVELAPLIAYGASPRATLAFSEASRAVAFLRGRGYVVPEDVKEIAKDVLRHRVLLTLRGGGRERHLRHGRRPHPRARRGPVDRSRTAPC